MYNLEEIKNIIKEHKDRFPQIFNTRNIVGDSMKQIYNKDGVIILKCEDYSYLEILGLKKEDFNSICDMENDHLIKI